MASDDSSPRDKKDLVKRFQGWFTFRGPDDDYALMWGKNGRKTVEKRFKSHADADQFEISLEKLRSKKGHRSLKKKRVARNSPIKIYQCRVKPEPGRLWFSLMDEEPDAVCHSATILGVSWNKDRQGEQIQAMAKRNKIPVDEWWGDHYDWDEEEVEVSPGISLELPYDTDFRPIISDATLAEILKFCDSQMGIRPTPAQINSMIHDKKPVFVNGQAGTGKTSMLALRVAAEAWLTMDSIPNRRTLVTSMSEKVTDLLQKSVNDMIPVGRSLSEPEILEKFHDNLEKSLSKENQEHWYHTREIEHFHLFQTFKQIQHDIIEKAKEEKAKEEKAKEDLEKAVESGSEEEIDKAEEEPEFDEQKNVNFSTFQYKFFSRRNYPKLNAELAWYGIRSILRGQCLKNSIGSYLDEADRELILTRGQFPEESVESLIKCHRDYSKWLKNKGYHDDMDIALETWKLLEQDNEWIGFDLFDEIYLDEAQDLTDLEFRILMKLLKPERVTSIVLAGDPLQTINPTGFNWANLKAMMFDSLREFKTALTKSDIADPMILTTNFRTPRNIVSVGNVVLRKRTDLTKDKDQEQTSNVPDGDILILIVTEAHKGELTELFRQDDAVNRFIITNKSDEDGVARLISEDEIIQVEPEDTRVRSITEVKGLETDTVVLYKFATNFSSDLIQVIREDKERHRIDPAQILPISYELNKLYIGLTRSKEKMLILEDKHNAEQFWKSSIFSDTQIEVIDDKENVSYHIQNEIIRSDETHDPLETAKELLQQYKDLGYPKFLKWALSNARKAQDSGRGSKKLIHQILALQSADEAQDEEDEKEQMQLWEKSATNHKAAQNYQEAYKIYLDKIVPLGGALKDPYLLLRDKPSVSKFRLNSESLILRLANNNAKKKDLNNIDELSRRPHWYSNQKHSKQLSNGLSNLIFKLDPREKREQIEKVLSLDLFDASTRELWLEQYGSSLDPNDFWKEISNRNDNFLSNELPKSPSLKNRLEFVAENQLANNEKNLLQYLSTLLTWHGIDENGRDGKIPENLIKKMLSAEFSQLRPSSIYDEKWPFKLPQEKHKEYIDFCRKSGYVLSGKLILLLENLGNDFWPNKLENSNIIELWKCFERPLSEFDKSIPDIEDFRDNDRLNSSIRTLVMSHVSLNSGKKDSSVNAPRFGNLHTSPIWEEACEDTNLMQALVGFFGEEWKTSPEAFCSNFMSSYEDKKPGAGYTIFESKYEEKALAILKQDPNTIARSLRRILYGRIDVKRITEKKGFNSEHVTYFKIASELDDDKREFSKEEIKEIISDLDKIEAEDLVDKAKESVKLGIDDIDEILIEEIEEKTKMERVLGIIQSKFTDKDRSIPKLVQILNNPTNVNTIITDEKLMEKLGIIARSWRRDDIKNSHDLLFYFHQSLFVYLYKLHKEEYKLHEQIDYKLIYKIVMIKKNELTRIEEIGKLYQDPGSVLETNHWWADDKKYLSSSLMMFHHRLQIEKPTIEQLRKDISDLRLPNPPKNATRPTLIRKIYEQFEGADILENPNLQNAFDTIIRK